MRIRIRYCKPCRYRLRAEALADALRRELDVEVELAPANFGVFRIWVEETLVYDKYKANGLAGRFGFGDPPPVATAIEAVRGYLEKFAVPSPWRALPAKDGAEGDADDV
jgi:selT/selW/selH-like putative selenoprotein